MAKEVADSCKERLKDMSREEGARRLVTSRQEATADVIKNELWIEEIKSAPGPWLKLRSSADKEIGMRG